MLSTPVGSMIGDKRDDGCGRARNSMVFTIRVSKACSEVGFPAFPNYQSGRFDVRILAHGRGFIAGDSECELSSVAH